MQSNPRVPFTLSNQRAPLAPMNGKHIIVNVAMNIEYWPFERPMPRGIIPAPHGVQPKPPDIPNFSWVEYGLRVGMPRIMAMLAKRNIKASALINAQVADVYPSLMDAVIAADWELVGHGWFQQSLKQADDQADTIAKSLDRLEKANGKRPRAWLGPGLGETDETVDLLKENGIDFLHDWVVDDVPFWMRTKHGPMVGLPYTFDLNDVPIYAVQNQSSDEYLKRIEATLATFSAEAVPRVMTLALHPHIIGVPSVAHYFEQALDLLVQRDDTVFATSTEIGEWFVQADGTNGKELTD